jgi:hypothetical protein
MKVTPRKKWIALIKYFSLFTLLFSSLAIGADKEGLSSGDLLKIFIPLAAVFVASVIAPLWVDRNKTNRSKKILKRIILADISDRTQQLTAQKNLLEVMIEKCKKEPDYEPVMIIARGMEGYIDWTAEKWLLPSDLSGQILFFYNNEASLYQFIAVIFDNAVLEEKLGRERKIGAMQSLYFQMQDLENHAKELIPLLK